MPTIKAVFSSAEVVNTDNFRLDFRLDGLLPWIERLTEIDLVPAFSTAQAALVITDGSQTAGYSVSASSRTQNNSAIISYEIAIGTIKMLVDYMNTYHVDGTFTFGFICDINDTVNEGLGFSRCVLNQTILMELPLELTLDWLLIFIGVAESQKICEPLASSTYCT